MASVNTGGVSQQSVLKTAMRNLSDRIFKGVRDQSLTKTEYDQLSKDLDSLDAAVKKAGTNLIDEGEYSSLLSRVSGLSQKIFDERHDAEGNLAVPTPDEASEDFSTKREVIRAGMANLEQRIVDGIRDGSLSGSESGRLLKGLYALKDKFERQLADGRIDQAEYAADLESVSRLSRDVFDFRHNNYPFLVS